MRGCCPGAGGRRLVGRPGDGFQVLEHLGQRPAADAGRQADRRRELAGRLEVSERTILRDMDALSGSGIPVVAERGNGGGWSLLENYQTKLTGLSPAEIQALFLSHPARLMGRRRERREFRRRRPGGAGGPCRPPDGR